MEHFSDWLTWQMTLQGIDTQRAMWLWLDRHRVPMSESSLSKYCRGERKPSRQRLELIMDALGTPPAQREHVRRLAAGVGR